MNAVTNTITSKDGTTIAFEKTGQGPAVVLVDGALCYRASGPSRPLAALLAERFTVYAYDRRGRGESGDNPQYAVEREVEDIDALIKHAGGSAFVYGISSGAALALEAASNLKNITKLALYEAPFIVDDTLPARPADYIQRMDALIAANKRGDAVKMFMKTVGVPGIFITMMSLMPMWKTMKGIAHTLPYDFRILGDTGSGKPLPAGRWSAATIPTLVMDGGKSPEWMRNAMRSLAKMLPCAEYRTLEGQTHMLKAEAVAPVLVEFFAN
jgi:pimeloyl-ACP methyl ester carboxylesterase